MDRFDLTVIGAGPGGYVAAIKAAQLGKKVAIVEGKDVGGTCLNRGCVPTKALLHSAETYEEIVKNSEKLGIHVEGVSYDFAQMHARKEEVVTQLRTGVESLFKANKIELIRGYGKVLDAHTVQVGDEKIDTDKIMLATGSYPACPPIPGLDLPGVITSDEMLEGSGVECKSLVIIGGGVIGVEFASVYRALGCEVTIVEAMDRMLPTLDKDIAQNLNMIFKKRGIKVNTGAMVKSVEGEDGNLTVNFVMKEKENSVTAEKVLVCIGRRANTAGVVAEDMDLQMQRGYIPVNENYETCIPGIYAIGDIVMGGIQLAHAASAEAINAVCSMFGEEAPKNCKVVPSCIYTNPEIACVGMTDAQAKEAGIETIIGKNLTMSNGKHIIAMSDRGFVKMVFRAEDKVLIGATMMCQRATDMLGIMIDAVVNEQTLEDLSKVIWPHPTFSEVIGEAIEDAEGGSIHSAPKRK